MKIFTCLKLAAFAFLATSASAQLAISPINSSYNTSSPPQINSTLTMSVGTGIGYQIKFQDGTFPNMSGCSVKWTVTDGIIFPNSSYTPNTFESVLTNNSNQIYIRWQNKLTYFPQGQPAESRGKITAQFSGTSCAYNGTTVPSVNVPIRYFAKPGAVVVSGTSGGSVTASCGTQSKTLTVTAAQNATSYEWVNIPTAWTGSRTTTTASSTFQLDAGTQASNVYARSKRSDVPELYEIGPAINISRPLPTISSISLTDVKICTTGQTRSVSASGTNADKYIWTPSANVRVNGSTAAQTVAGAVNIGAVGSGTFTVKAFSTACNVASTSQVNGTAGLASPPNLNSLIYDFNNTPVSSLNVVSAYSDHYITLYPLDVSSYAWNQSWSSGVPSGAPGVNRFDFQLQPGQSLFFNPLSLTNACGTVTKTIEFYAQYSMKAYPNPATNSLNVDMPNTTRPDLLPDNIELYSEQTGKVVRSFSGSSSSKPNSKRSDKLQFNVSDLPRGTYYLHVSDSKRKKEVEKTKIVLQ